MVIRADGVPVRGDDVGAVRGVRVLVVVAVGVAFPAYGEVQHGDAFHENDGWHLDALHQSWIVGGLPCGTLLSDGIRRDSVTFRFSGGSAILPTGATS